MNTGNSLELKVHGPEAHGRQQPGREENWQDSVVLVWWDQANGVGGFHRIGHEPNVKGGGRIALWTNLITPDGIYKATRYNPLREADRLPDGGFGSGDDSCSYQYRDGQHVWTIQDGEVSAVLRHVDFHDTVDCYPKRGQLADDFAPAHFDIPGAVTGTLKVKSKEYAVNGLSVRDHGWGPRDWNAILSHRWIAGTVGREFGFIALAFHSIDDAIVSFGWVSRNGKITFAKKVDILTYMEHDAASNRGGRVHMELTDGEAINLECTPVAKGVASWHHEVCCMDVICRFDYRGQRGFCDFETTSNIHHGKRKPRRFSNAVIEDGFHPN
ncbi:MAG: hypothetical protein QJR02_00415 [Sinobacteraceae bacterium]|nr:hypothetical protein [Nevskiaceae bacterium]